jgi:hypothetical protein
LFLFFPSLFYLLNIIFSDDLLYLPRPPPPLERPPPELPELELPLDDERPPPEPLKLLLDDDVEGLVYVRDEEAGVDDDERELCTLPERPELDDSVWLRDEELTLELTRVRSVLAGVEVVTDVDRLLLVVPSVYRGVDDVPRPEELTVDGLLEDTLSEDVLPGELLLREDERPVEDE